MREHTSKIKSKISPLSQFGSRGAIGGEIVGGGTYGRYGEGHPNTDTRLR
jgi:hypothetical protein